MTHSENQSDSNTSHQPHEHDHAHGSTSLFIGVFAGLCVLTAISFAVGSSPLMDTPSVGWVLMIAVSVCKALLVMIYFMHLKWEANWKYVLTIPASAMSIFLILALVPDIGMRTFHYTAERWLYAPSAEHVNHHEEDGNHDHSDADHAHGEEGNHGDEHAAP